MTLDEEIPIGKTVGACQVTDEDGLGDVTFELAPRSVYFAADKGRLGTDVFYVTVIVSFYYLPSARLSVWRACSGLSEFGELPQGPPGHAWDVSVD